eukprot:CAMPEP_0206008886 /NCGR_PEP_ID=MMETSP1464-20131121/8487_1 /ASSEMBLY_ACC=CAM_ASM_001124 /TAXON_ID=119497 /ORGANISM="Exanthemachrysis gayraliae, Strain RCC1523" /LENGTH=150 /DNA_ID=CAMNT_0053382455 /DNA_START=15 /DNA_END=467 /DNA_ORIENTATION=+
MMRDTNFTSVQAAPPTERFAMRACGICGTAAHSHAASDRFKPTLTRSPALHPCPVQDRRPSTSPHSTTTISPCAAVAHRRLPPPSARPGPHPIRPSPKLPADRLLEPRAGPDLEAQVAEVLVGQQPKGIEVDVLRHQRVEVVREAVAREE